MMRALFLYVALAVVLSTVGKALAQGDELPPTRYVWSASGQTGSFIYDVNAPFNPIFELTWDQANTTHSGEAIQYNVTRDNITGTQIVFTGGQIGQGFFSIQMQHPDSGLPSIPSGFDFLPPDDLGIGWIGGQFITSTSSSPIDSIFNDGFAILPPNDAPVFTATRINGIDGDLVINESGAATNLTLDAQATDVQAGFLYFTIDGVGPTAAANTGAGSLRSSQSVNRSVGGADSNGLPAASYEFTVIDPRGAEAVVTRNVFVQNVAPTVTSYTLDGLAGGLVFDEGTAFSIAGAMQATDPGADAITFAIDGQSAGSGGATPGSTRSSTGVTIDFDGQSGVYPVSFAATDDDETTTVTRNVTVNNLPPVIESSKLNGLDDDLVVQEGDPIVVVASMSASDPGPDALEFRIDNQPAGIGGATPQSVRESLEVLIFLDGQDGAYPILFEAVDDQTQANAVRTVTVENVAPTVTSIDLSKTTINEGEQLTATVQATDPGPDALTMTVNGIDAGVGGAGPSSIRTSDTVTIGPFPQRSVGSDEVEILATAIDDGQVPGELIETITVLNLPPVITSLTEDGVVAPGETFRFLARASDPGLDTLTFRWDTDSDGEYDDLSGAGGVFSPLSYTPDTVGLFPLRLLVEDGDGGEATATISVISVSLPSDFNNDGAVDAADYTVWRDHVDQPFGALLNDPTGETVGAAQYDLWRANFGESLASTLTTVPEPASLALLLLCSLCRKRSPHS